ncbi:MAG: hypothetical protein E6565_11480, partial [Staphylococcus epidermidis]|nr:hypothetical protein [Staphylococcus epidermidis]
IFLENIRPVDIDGNGFYGYWLAGKSGHHLIFSRGIKSDCLMAIASAVPAKINELTACFYYLRATHPGYI